MIVELEGIDLDILNHSMLQKQVVIHELSHNPYAKYLIYIENNEVRGYLYYSDIYERVEINQIEVEVIYRNCGIGTKLLKKLIDSVSKSITLEVRKDNFSAIRLYEKFNFVKKAVRRGYYQGIDGILMERSV